MHGYSWGAIAMSGWIKLHTVQYTVDPEVSGDFIQVRALFDPYALSLS